MTKISDAREAELLASAEPGHGPSSARGKKRKISKEDVDVIDISEDQASASSSAARTSVKESSGSAEGGRKKRASAEKDPLPDGTEEDTPQEEDSSAEGDDSPEVMEAELEQAQEGELVPDEDFSTLDDFNEDGKVIDLGSNLPALAQDRLPSVPVRDNLQSYLREVSKFPLLEPEEETELARRVRDHGDPQAAFRIISSHLRLVVRIAMDFQRRWMQNVLDLIQEGNVGLLRAVNKFDPDKGIKFSYYASFWIKAYILKFIMDNWRMVKIGTTQVQRKLFYNLNRERQKLIAQGFDPDAAMLSERLGVSEEQINEMDQRLAAGDLSLNAQVGDEPGGATRMDFLPALGPGIEDDLASGEMAGILRDRIKTLLPKLNEKELYILQNRLLTDDPVTLREIGERYNVTRERVRQLEARLLEKIRRHIAGDVKDFSDEWIQS